MSFAILLTPIPGKENSLESKFKSKQIHIIDGKLIINADYPFNVIENDLTDGNIPKTIKGRKIDKHYRIFGDMNAQIANIYFSGNDFAIKLVERGLAPLGIYYAIKNELVVVSDNLNIVKNIVYQNEKIQFNEEYLASNALINGCIDGTPYRDIHKLRSGFSVVFENGKWGNQQRWFKPQTSITKQSEKYFEEKIDECLSNSIQKVINSESIVGLSLSGGLDSSSILSLMNENNPKKSEIITISWHYPNAPIGIENTFIESASEHFNVKNIMLEDSDILDIKSIESILTDNSQWFPVPTSSVLFAERVLKMNQLSKSLKIKSMFSGHGGDFLFDSRLSFYSNNWREVPKNCFQLSVNFETNFWAEIRGKYIRPILLKAPENYYLELYGTKVPPFVNFGNWKHLMRKLRVFLNEFTEDLKEPSLKHVLWQAMIFDDIDSTRSNVRYIHPFLDHNLLEIILNYSRFYNHTTNISGNTFKPLLKKIMTGRLPDLIVSRNHKSRVDWAIVDALKKNKKVIAEIVRDGWLVKNDYIHFEKWQSNLNSIIEGKYTGINEIIRPLSLEVWMNNVANS
nr:asparagine synthase-related protein [Paenibacillus bovis]